MGAGKWCFHRIRSIKNNPEDAEHAIFVLCETVERMHMVIGLVEAVMMLKAENATDKLLRIEKIISSYDISAPKL